VSQLLSFYDTATEPTEAMRDAMRAAPVGDDVYGHDQTVNELEELGAALLGKEAAVFMPSGTMANLAAVMAHTCRGDAVLLEARSHLARAEAGGLAVVAGCMPVPVCAERGILGPLHVEPHLEPPDEHRASVRLVCVENTHNRAGGTATPSAVMRELRNLCDGWDVRIHVDGARLLNAAIALDVAPSTLAADADSVSFALSKALGAPVGSLLLGSRRFVATARRNRKLLGGGMRQAGVVAAAAIVALEDWRRRLEEDHRRAARLADMLDALHGVTVEPRLVPTNIVYCHIDGTGLLAREVAERLLEREIFCAATSLRTLRFVTHCQIGDDDLTRLVTALAEIVEEDDR
jgi:threonine aldolase